MKKKLLYATGDGLYYGFSGEASRDFWCALGKGRHKIAELPPGTHEVEVIRYDAMVAKKTIRSGLPIIIDIEDVDFHEAVDISVLTHLIELLESHGEKAFIKLDAGANNISGHIEVP